MSQINDPNIVLNNLIHKIKSCLGKAEYTKKTHKTNILKPRKDWVTKAIMISSKTKENLYEMWKKDPNINRKREEYKKFTNILKDIVNKAKKSYNKKLIELGMINIKFEKEPSMNNIKFEKESSMNNIRIEKKK